LEQKKKALKERKERRIKSAKQHLEDIEAKIKKEKEIKQNQDAGIKTTESFPFIKITLPALTGNKGETSKEDSTKQTADKKKDEKTFDPFTEMKKETKNKDQVKFGEVLKTIKNLPNKPGKNSIYMEGKIKFPQQNPKAEYNITGYISKEN